GAGGVLIVTESFAVFKSRDVAPAPILPALWDQSEFGVVESVGEEGGGGGVEAGGRAEIELGADGVEIDEPGLEEGPRHRLQRLVHPPVQLDLVVERAEGAGDGALLMKRWQLESEVLNSGWRGMQDLCARSAQVKLPIEFRPEKQPVEKVGVHVSRLSDHDSAKSLVMQVRSAIVRHSCGNSQYLTAGCLT